MCQIQTEKKNIPPYIRKNQTVSSLDIRAPQIFLSFVLDLESRNERKNAREFATKIRNKNSHRSLMFGMKKSLTFVGLLAITGANAGAVDLTEGDFDAQVLESGKVR